MTRSKLICISFFALAGCASEPDKNEPIIHPASTDSGTTTSEAGTDAGSCTPTAPPSGYSVIDHSRGTGDSDRGNNFAMAVDENGSPMVAYDADGGAGKQIWYTRWERSCHSGWTPPVLVDDVSATTDTPRGISIAYDPTTHTTGIAYVIRNADLTVRHAYEVRYASVVPIANPAPMKGAPHDKVTRDPAPLRQEWTDDGMDPADPETVAIAVRGGSTWVAWMEPFSITGCVTSYCEAVKWVRRDGTAPWSAPVKVETRGISNVQLGLVVDGGKNPTLSYVVTDAMGTTSTAMFHPLTGTAAPTPIMTGIATEDTNAVLAMAGEEYVAAVYLHPVGWAKGKTSLYFARLKGSTWNVVPVNAEKGDDWGYQISIVGGSAIGAQVAITAPIVGGEGVTYTYGTPKYVTVDPKTDALTLHGPDRSYFFGSVRWPQIAFDGTKSQIGFGQPTNYSMSTTLAPGIAYWREK